MNVEPIRRLLKPVFFALLALFVVSFASRGRFVEPEAIDPLLLEEPLQAETARPPFDFEYKGKVCSVRPVAMYELRGLVVSHNDIESLSDMVHDSTSVDTKDLCVIWGENLLTDEFHRVDFKSGQFTCYYSYPSDARFRQRALGNNHLITDDERVRKQIAEVRVGDQVRLRGLLVDYRMDDWGKFWRRTSTRRTDSGCEVVFVETLEVLERGTPGWYSAYRWSGRLLLAIPFVYVLLLWLEVKPPPGARAG